MILIKTTRLRHSILDLINKDWPFDFSSWNSDLWIYTLNPTLEQRLTELGYSCESQQIEAECNKTTFWFTFSRGGRKVWLFSTSAMVASPHPQRASTINIAHSNGRTITVLNDTRPIRI